MARKFSKLPPLNYHRNLMGIKINDTVLAHHGVMIYEAKVLKIDHGSGVHEDNDKIKPTATTQYFVHWLGWAKKWDEWVAFDRVLEDTPENRKLQAEAKDKAASMPKAAAKKRKISAHGIVEVNASKKGSPFKKMKINPDDETEEMDMENPEFDTARNVALQIPFSLKKQLVDDWKHVTQAPYHLVSLPRKPCVAQIIANYLEFKQSKMKVENDAEDKEFKNIQGLMDGIQVYFDKALGSILLYRFERKQYQEIKEQHENTPMSQIYGGEHLLRLFVRLPVLLGNATIPDREMKQIQPRLNDFLKYMQKHSSTLFLSDYEVADENYVMNAIPQ